MVDLPLPARIFRFFLVAWLSFYGRYRRLVHLVVGASFLYGFVVTFDGLVRYNFDQVMTFHAQWGTLQDEQQFEKRMLEHRKKLSEPLPPGEFALLSNPVPFREVSAPFDDDALCWGTDLSAGVLVFDADGDGRQDLYFPQAQSTVARPTDENGIFLDKPRLQHNGLYMNRGNGPDGTPKFVQIKELARANDTFVEEELLIEDYLFPRRSTSDSEDREGRLSLVAAAADLNADGRLDVIVGNGLPGLLISHPSTQAVVVPFINPTGREVHKVEERLEHAWLRFIKDYEPRNDQDGTRESARGVEPLGANSVYLNMGDRDGDGLPEWRDATIETGLSGKRNTIGLVVVDIDLDGDLDLYTANSGDPDFWPGGARALGGEANQLYINQLAQTGELRFVERSREMDVDGLVDDDTPETRFWHVKRLPFFPEQYSFILPWWTSRTLGFLELNGTRSEPGEWTWAATSHDANDDGYPDLWAANDFTYLRLYLNTGGGEFREPSRHARSDKTGSWMSFAHGDFNGDLKEDLFVGNLGGSTVNMSLTQPTPNNLLDPSITIGTFAQQHWLGNHSTLHVLVDGSDFRRELQSKVRHSRIMPPDVSMPNNVRTWSTQLLPKFRFDPDSLDAYEFCWGIWPFDVQNDGRLDLYWIGGLFTRGGGIFPITASNPGRLLVNATVSPDRLRFVDRTAEYHLFNILHLDYSELDTKGRISRPSPSQNWGRRSVTYSTDLSVWGLIGPRINDKVSSHDLIQTSENGRSVVATDLNGDGFQDVILRNFAGYDSRSPHAKNLKTRINGKVVVLPPSDPNLPSATNFEPGSTRLFINTHSASTGGGNWIDLELIDDTAGSFNRFAIGAKVIVNDRLLRVRHIGGSFCGNAHEPLHFGLGKETARRVTIRWPDADLTVTHHDLKGVTNRKVVIRKSGALTL